MTRSSRRPSPPTPSCPLVPPRWLVVRVPAHGNTSSIIPTLGPTCHLNSAVAGYERAQAISPIQSRAPSQLSHAHLPEMRSQRTLKGVPDPPDMARSHSFRSEEHTSELQSLR